MFSKTIIVGRVTQDIELKQTPNGVSVASFSVAVDRSYTPKGQERQTDFYSVTAWRSTAEFCARYFGRGKPILIEGEMQARKYTDKNGNNRTAWELIADRVSFVGGKNEGGGDTPKASPDVSAEDFVDIDDDGDLPFA